MNTTENNKLIAEFMGFKFCKNYYETPFTQWKWLSFPLGGEGFNTTNEFTIEELLFHSSWDWLMPVVEKIESLGFKVNIFGYNEDTESHYVIVYSSKEGTISIQNQSKLPKIQAVYNACVEFIKWYNEQKQQL